MTLLDSLSFLGYWPRGTEFFCTLVAVSTAGVIGLHFGYTLLRRRRYKVGVLCALPSAGLIAILLSDPLVLTLQSPVWMTTRGFFERGDVEPKFKIINFPLDPDPNWDPGDRRPSSVVARDLQSSEPAARMSAAHVLRLRGKAATMDLISYLEQADSDEVVLHGMTILNEVKDPSAADFFTRRLILNLPKENYIIRSYFFWKWPDHSCSNYKKS